MKAVELYKKITGITKMKKGISAEKIFYFINGIGILTSIISAILIIYGKLNIAIALSIFPTMILLANIFLAAIFKKLTFPFVFDIFKMKWRKEFWKCLIFVLDSSGNMDVRVGIVDPTMKRVFDPITNFYYRYSGREIFHLHGIPALIVYNHIGQAIDPIVLKAIQKIKEMGFEDKYDFIRAINGLKKEISKLEEEYNTYKSIGEDKKLNEIQQKLKKKKAALKMIEDTLSTVPLFNINLEAVMNYLSNQNAHLDLLAIETAFTAGQQMARRDDFTSMSDIMKYMIPMMMFFMLIIGAVMFMKGG